MKLKYVMIPLLVSAYTLSAQNVEVVMQDQVAIIMQESDTLLVYNITDRALEGKYARANYIHPLFLPGGGVLTEDFPADHLHHRGIFWAWHQLYIGDQRIGDGWDIRDLYWDVQSVEATEGPGETRGIRTHVYWKSPLRKEVSGSDSPLVKEEASIRVIANDTTLRIIDIEISLLALEEDMRLGGSENEKGYGGFTTRIRLKEPMEFTGPAGPVIPDNLPVEAGGWIDITGPVGNNGKAAGIAILSHPGNPGYPNPWILRASASAQNAVYPHPGAEAVTLSSSEPIVLRYRLVVHSGKLSTKTLDAIHAEFSSMYPAD